MVKKAVIATVVFAVSILTAGSVAFAQTATPTNSPTPTGASATSTPSPAVMAATTTPTPTAAVPGGAPKTGRGQ